MQTLEDPKVVKKTVYGLKAIGHELIDEIVDMGFDRSWVYISLGRHLGFPGNWKHHFSQMHTEKELFKAIHKLKKMKEKCIKIKENKSAVYSKNLEKIKEVGRQNSIKVKRQRGAFYKAFLKLRTGVILLFKK